MVLHIKPVERLAQPAMEHYIENAKVEKCMQTGTPFGFFTRRHHCRVSGQIFVDEVSSFL
jgi:myosin-1